MQFSTKDYSNLEMEMNKVFVSGEEKAIPMNWHGLTEIKKRRKNNANNQGTTKFVDTVLWHHTNCDVPEEDLMDREHHGLPDTKRPRWKHIESLIGLAAEIIIMLCCLWMAFSGH